MKISVFIKKKSDFLSSDCFSFKIYSDYLSCFNSYAVHTYYSTYIYFVVVMPPTLEKLKRHIASGLSVRTNFKIWV